MNNMNLIASADRRRGIGRDNKLLFHIPEDMKLFRELTMGAAIVMGRKTMQSLPGMKPLDGRVNIVLSRDENISAEGFIICRSLDELFEKLENLNKPVFVIGGGEIYSLLLPYCDCAYITHIDADGDADVFLPEFGAEWHLVDKSEPHESGGLKYWFCKYEKCLL